MVPENLWETRNWFKNIAQDGFVLPNIPLLREMAPEILVKMDRNGWITHALTIRETTLNPMTEEFNSEIINIINHICDLEDVYSCNTELVNSLKILRTYYFVEEVFAIPNLIELNDDIVNVLSANNFTINREVVKSALEILDPICKQYVSKCDNDFEPLRSEKLHIISDEMEWRPHLKYAALLIDSILENKKDDELVEMLSEVLEILADHKMRSGKSFLAVVYVALLYNHICGRGDGDTKNINIAIHCNYKDAIPKIIDNIRNFCGDSVMINELRTLEVTATSGHEFITDQPAINIIHGTYQSLQYEGREPLYALIKNQTIHSTIEDEVQRAAEAEKTKEHINKLNPQRRFNMSGTPNRPVHSTMQRTRHPYIEEQGLASLGYEHYKNFPELKVAFLHGKFLDEMNKLEHEYKSPDELFIFLDNKTRLDDSGINKCHHEHELCEREFPKFIIQNIWAMEDDSFRKKWKNTKSRLKNFLIEYEATSKFGKALKNAVNWDSFKWVQSLDAFHQKDFSMSSRSWKIQRIIKNKLAWTNWNWVNLLAPVYFSNYLKCDRQVSAMRIFNILENDKTTSKCFHTILLDTDTKNDIEESARVLSRHAAGKPIRQYKTVNGRRVPAMQVPEAKHVKALVDDGHYVRDVQHLEEVLEELGDKPYNVILCDMGSVGSTLTILDKVIVLGDTNSPADYLQFTARPGTEFEGKHHYTVADWNKERLEYLLGKPIMEIEASTGGGATIKINDNVSLTENVLDIADIGLKFEDNQVLVQQYLTMQRQPQKPQRTTNNPFQGYTSDSLDDIFDDDDDDDLSEYVNMGGL